MTKQPTIKEIEPKAYKTMLGMEHYIAKRS